MHYCAHIITRKFPTDGVIGEILDPYYMNMDKVFSWDWYVIGGRYGGGFKLNTNTESNEYNWDYWVKEPRAGRLFRSDIIERALSGIRLFDEDKAFRYMGIRDGFLYVDGAKISDIIDFDQKCTDCFIFIGPDETVYVRQNWDDKAKDWIPDNNFEEEVKEALVGCEDCYATIVDLHD